MNEEIAFRLNRLYSAIGETVKTDFAAIKQKNIKTDKGSAHVIDFKGGYMDAQLSNFAHMAISNVAALHDHIKRWVRHHKKDESIFKKLFMASPNIMAIIDLNNNDKHGYPPRDKGLTKKSIRLMKVKRTLKVSSAPRGVASPTTPEDCPVKIKQGRAGLIVTAQIVDGEGKHFGHLHECLMLAIAEYDKIIAAYS